MMRVVCWSLILLGLTVCLTGTLGLESNQMLFSPASQCLGNQSYSSVSLSCTPCHRRARGEAGQCRCLPGWRLTAWEPEAGVRCERCGAGEEVTVVLSPITGPGPSSECASVGVSFESTEQRGRGPEPETLPL